MRKCEANGFDAEVDEDNNITLTGDDNIQYFIFHKYPYIFFAKCGEIGDDLDKVLLKTAINDYNSRNRPVRITISDNIAYFCIFSCNPIPWNFYQSFDYHLAVFEGAEQELESTYLALKNKPDIPTS